MSFERPEQAEAARRALEREGFDVALQPQRDGGVVLVTEPTATPSTVSALGKRLTRLANEFDGSYMGHGELSSTPLRRHS